MTYTIWKPEHDGHAPPNWREGMAWKTYQGVNNSNPSSWYEGVLYYVPSEALNSPNDDAAFDVAIWLEQGRANLDKLPEGVALPEPKDWATELWADLLEVTGLRAWMPDIREHRLREYDRVAIELLRTRFEQMKGEG